jgi:hypothetical protein
MGFISPTLRQNRAADQGIDLAAFIPHVEDKKLFTTFRNIPLNHDLASWHPVPIPGRRTSDL